MITSQDRPLGEPRQMSDFLNVRPVTSSLHEEWGEVVLQRFHHSSGLVEVPAMRTEVLVGHLGGPFLAEVGAGTRHYERRWIGPGQFGVNPAGMPIRRDVKGRPDVVLVHLSPSRLRAVAEEMFDRDGARVELVPTLAVNDDTAARLLALLLREAESPEPGLPLMVESLIRALTVHTLRSHSTLAPQKGQPPHGLSPGRVGRVMDHMRANLDRKMSLADLAQVAGLSASRFVRAFRMATGQPPHYFLIRLRIEEARRLLEETELPVSDIGVRCGFDQPSHFASVFRQVIGLTPSMWRQQRRL